jgi:hypothetical protein
MADLNALIREYFEIVEQEYGLEERKKLLRTAISNEMANQKLKWTRAEQGTASRISRFKLIPRPEPMLEVLNKDDLLAFAHFTPARVKELLVPKYGRERLIPLFDIEKHEMLVLKRHSGVN